MLEKGQRVVFVSYDDAVYGVEYGGKEATILEVYHDFGVIGEPYSELLVEFDDGCKLTALENELVRVKNA